MAHSGKYIFVILFEKMSPGPKNVSKDASRDSLQFCAKNQVLKSNIDKVTVIRDTQMPLPGDPPCTVSIHPVLTYSGARARYLPL